MKNNLIKAIVIAMAAMVVLSAGGMAFAKVNQEKIYKKFLTKNESTFVVEEYD